MNGEFPESRMVRLRINRGFLPTSKLDETSRLLVNHRGAPLPLPMDLVRWPAAPLRRGQLRNLRHQVCQQSDAKQDRSRRHRDCWAWLVLRPPAIFAALVFG